jgi:hypothetical protein
MDERRLQTTMNLLTLLLVLVLVGSFTAVIRAALSVG